MEPNNNEIANVIDLLTYRIKNLSESWKLITTDTRQAENSCTAAVQAFEKKKKKKPKTRKKGQNLLVVLLQLVV